MKATGLRLALAAVALLLLSAGPSLAERPAFPGDEPSGAYPASQESPRAKTPDDPEFDQCEGDDEDPGGSSCTSYFEEQYGLFGFGPDSSTAQYLDCGQLDDQGRDANAKAGDPPCKQLSGVRADSAWKFGDRAGDPRVAVAILDTGIRWESTELVDKVRLNRAELPEPGGGRPQPLAPFNDPPAKDGDQPCAAFTGTGYDRDGDGAVSVGDYACDSRVDPAAGDDEADSILDASDLIARFSDRRDDDSNGYVDDIAGWDFFDDDNDPFDVSSCCSASNHGTGRAQEAAADTNNAEGGAGLCPECQVIPLRVWDTFVVDTNLFSMGVAYAADNGAEVVEGAVGGLLNSSFARRVFRYADRKGVTLTLVSSDLNTANHNYPTNYNEAIYVGGTLPDTAPNETCEGPGLPGAAAPEPPSGGGFTEGCNAFLAALEQATGGAVQPSTQPPTTSFFRNANLTQYGGKADIVLVGATGSENTGQASGAAGVLESYARDRFTGARRQLSNNEVRQLLTMSAEDVRPANTGIIGLPDKAEVGWDPHFGYGRVNLAGAMRMIQAGRIPPEAQLDGPDWFAPINVDRMGSGGVPVRGRVAAPHSDSGPGRWVVQYACGQDAPDSAFQSTGISGSGPRKGTLGRLSPGLLRRLADSCNGEVRNDAGRPAGRASDGAWPADPYPDPDPERKAFQIRLVVREQGDEANRGIYRKTLFAYRDDGNLRGFPKPIGSGSEEGALITGAGGEASPRLVDLDGDNGLEYLLPTSAGELFALDGRGRSTGAWNGGRPVTTDAYRVAANHSAPGGLERPREPLRTPAVGDLTGDGEPEVVATAGEHFYAWDRRGRRLFKQRIDPALSEPCNPGAPEPCFHPADRAIDRSNHIKRGFIGSPALADLNGDRRLDVVAGSLDQHVYALDGRGRPLPGFPRRLRSPDAEAGAEIVTSPAIAELDGDRRPEIVLATNEVVGASGRPPPPGELGSGSFLGAFLGAAVGSSVVYAINHDGSRVAGSWPARLGTLLPDVLPLVGPGHDAAVLDVDRDGRDEVSVSATTAEAQLLRGDGSRRRTYQGGSPSDGFDPARQFNLFEYSSVGDILGAGRPSVLKGGISSGGVVNLAAPNQNVPFNHTLQGWEPETGAQLPGFPRATDDFQLLSQPAVAKVGGAGRERHALVGTGLYQMHAYGPGAREPAGWPKFAGGWLFATPAVGDLDGDRRLDVAAVTREGFSFAWRTGTPACQTDSGATTNSEWWTFHHDEFGTANYRTDSRPPSRPPSGIARTAAGPDDLLAFRASGDDLSCGRAASYEVRGSNRSIDDGADFAAARKLVVRNQSSGGQARLRVEDARRFRFLAVRAVDDSGNVSYVRSVSTRRPGSTDGTDGDDVLVGTAGRDVIDCGSGHDWVAAGGGDDVIRCGSGNDIVQAGSGNDRVHGDSGDDRIDGGRGDDTLHGDSGNDRISGGPGQDRIRGGSGRNAITQ